ncbi:hypothetical protein [Halobaculum rubrum]|uniref:hypothetical protein n=1 Tax=Halobaculum rubrum TaxID=2872158 RepID=UPI001CA3F6C5|nr:hypothetical protein [Halobaculum rubrum]QZY01161.1 hypothetical protein K6T25_15340 [Halobaculum rubrum]
MRPATTGAVEAYLIHPLDPSLPEGTDGMGGELAATHEAICAASLEDHPTTAEIVADGRILLRVRLGSDESTAEIEHCVEALTAVATETTRLHRRLRETLRRWREGDRDER